MFKQIFDCQNAKFIYFVLRITNRCNLNCEYCVTACNLPIDKQSENVFRRKVYTVDPSDMELFCERFKGIGENDRHQLSGGEPTILPPKLLSEIVNILYFHKRKVGIITNGFALLDVPFDALNKFEYIELDDHGINHEHIVECKKYLQKNYKGPVKVLDITHHYDFATFKGSPETLGKKCPIWLCAPSMEERVIYPCCTLYCTSVLDNNSKIRDSLRNAGWTLDNKDIINTIQNYRNTLPECVVDQCINKCYNPAKVWPMKYAKDITLKPNDIICKGKKLI